MELPTVTWGCGREETMMMGVEWSGPLLSSSAGGEPGRALGPSHGPRLRVRADSGGAWKPRWILLEPVFEGLQAEC